MILICGMLLWGPKLSILNSQFTIYHFVYVQLAAYTLTAALALMVIARKVKFSLFNFHFSIPFSLVILRHSAPFALLVLLMASYNRIDPILLRSMASDADAGIYAGAFRLLDALTMVAYLVSVPLLPVFSRLCHEREKGEIADVIRLVFWPLMLFSFVTAALGAFFAEPLMQWLYPEHYAPYIPVFRLLIFGLIPIGLTYIFGTLLTAGGCLRQLNIFAASSLGINLVVNLMLIPRFGAMGSAVASLTAQTFMAVAQLGLAIRHFRLPVGVFLPPLPSDIRRTFSQVDFFSKE